MVKGLLLNGLAPWRSPTASTAPHSLDGVLLPAYVLRCLFFLSVLPALAVLPAYVLRCLFFLSVLPALAVLPAYAACAACGLALFFYSVICVCT
jgi:hypothetical protein